MKLAEYFEELLFPLPRICPLCGKKQEKMQLCSECYRLLLYKRSQYGQCQRCSTFGQSTSSCANCRNWPRYLEANYSAWPYQGEYREVIINFKFANQPWLANCLAKEMLPLLPSGYDVLVPVPLHSSRLKERGYNQSLLLAKELSKLSGLPCREYLLRIKATKHQAELSHKQREENLKQAFAVSPKAELKNQRIILIDDIFTTGATILACSKVLVQAGAKSVSSVTLAAGID